MHRRDAGGAEVSIHRSLRLLCCCGDMTFLQEIHAMTSLQKCTAATPGAQRTLKTNQDGCVAQHAGA